MYYDVKETGMRIQKMRKLCGLTQNQLAEKLNISNNGMSRIEQGVNGASIDIVIELAVILDTTTDYLLMGRENQIEHIVLTEKIEKMEKQQDEMLELLRTMSNSHSNCEYPSLP